METSPEVEKIDTAKDMSSANSHVGGTMPLAAGNALDGVNSHREPVVSEGDDEVINDQRGKLGPAPMGAAPPKKKSKKKKSKSKRGLNAPTGFEEFYVDVPVTPAEHEEERGLYHPSILFSERIQTAIQRYFSRRNLNLERKDVFDKYMAHGGIEAGQKMFSSGLDQIASSEMTAAEKKALNATHFVAPGRGGPDDEDFVVDFEGCTKAFLSSRLPALYDLQSRQRIKDYIAIIRNFLNYVLHHDVCPEYTDDINAARVICDQAVEQLSSIARAHVSLPGQFNHACSEIFGGFYSGSYIGDKEWAQGLDIPMGMSPALALRIFRTGMTVLAPNKIFEQYKSQSMKDNITMTSTNDASFEITALIPADQYTLKMYDQKFADGIKPLGKMKARTWRGAPSVEQDLTEEEEAAAAITAKEIKEYEFWVEDEIIQRCFIGMKIETTIHHLSFGIDFFDNIAGLYCSFYNSLPNEAMIGWKEPGPKLPMREKPVNSDDVLEGDKEDDDFEG